MISPDIKANNTLAGGASISCDKVAGLDRLLGTSYAWRVSSSVKRLDMTPPNTEGANILEHNDAMGMYPPG